MKKRNSKIVLVCSCMAFGLAAAAFAGCDFKREETLFGEWTTTLEATCEETGLQTRVSLSDPSVIETRALPAHGHDWAEWEQAAAPSCLVAGVKKRACNTCENEDFAPIPALGHDWGEWDTAAEPTCNTDGYAMRTCLRDGTHTDTRALQASGHDFGEWVVTKAPACSTGGIEKRVCRTCNDHTEIRAIAALGHDWNDLVTTQAPTCTEEGEAKRICRNDASHTVTESVPALGHEWSEWVATKEPALEEDGEEMRVCANNSAHTEMRPLAFAETACLEFVLNEEGTEYSVGVKRSEKSNIVSVRIPAIHNGLPVTALYHSAFSSCINLEKIEFSGNNLKTIGNNAFTSCKKLRSLEIPEGVTTIGRVFVTNCFALEKLCLPASVIDVARGAFLGLPALKTELTVAQDNPVYLADGGCLIEHETGRVTTTTYGATIPEYAKEIAEHAFYWLGPSANGSVRTITIPQGIERIEKNAFSGVAKFTRIVVKGFASKEEAAAVWGEDWCLPSGSGCDIVYARGQKDDTFYYFLNEVKTAYSVKIIDLFADEATIPAAYNGLPVTAIADRGFAFCKNLKQVTVLGNRLTDIGRYAFENCIGITNFEIPKSVKIIGFGAFIEWEDNQTITVKGFASQAVADTAWGTEWRLGCRANIIYRGNSEDQILPDGTKTIGAGAFSGCTSIHQIVIPASVESVGVGAFMNWTENQTIIVMGFASQAAADSVWGANWRKGCNAKIIYKG